jgi:hypothetical protein
MQKGQRKLKKKSRSQSRALPRDHPISGWADAEDRAAQPGRLGGFYGLMFIYSGLLGGIAAAMWSSDIISKEERDKTVE